MKNRPLMALRAASSSDKDQASTKVLSEPGAAPQANSTSITDQLTGDGIHIAALWKSPRDRRQAIQVTIKSYHGSPYLDCRVYTTNPHGRMVPTPKGITVSLQKLPQFAKAVGDGLRRATALGLAAGSS